MALYWTASDEDGWRSDLIAALKAEASAALAEWMVGAYVTASEASHRESIFEILSAIRGEAAAAALIAGAQSTTDPIARQGLVDLLSQRTVETEIPSLEIAARSPMENIAEATARGLASVGGSRAVKALVSAAEVSPHSYTIIRAISSTYTPFSQSALLELVGDPGKAPDLRVAAVKALARSHSERVRIALANLSIEPEMTQLDDAVADALTQLQVEAESSAPLLSITSPNSSEIGDESWSLMTKE